MRGEKRRATCMLGTRRSYMGCWLIIQVFFLIGKYRHWRYEA